MNLATSLRAAAVVAACALATTPAFADDYRDTVDRAHGEFQQFKGWVDEQLDDLQADVAELKAELAESGSAGKEHVDETVEELDELTGDVNQKMAELQTATADHWEEAKASVLSSWHRVQSAYFAALAELRGEQAD